MLKEGELVLFRHEARAFTDKQIELVQNFAAQAVIAIENARLLTELRMRTDELGRSVGELRALGEVSQAVNSTLDLQTVLETIVTKAAQLSNTDAGAIYVFDDADREFHLRATYGMDEELIEAIRHARIGGDERTSAILWPIASRRKTADLEAGGQFGSRQYCAACRLSVAAGGAAVPWRRHRRPFGCAPPHPRCLPAGHRRSDEDIRRAVGGGDPERAAL